MKAVDAFLTAFGDITLADVVVWGLALAFVYTVFKSGRDKLIDMYEEKRRKDERMEQTWEAVSKYPEYRKQSVQIQELLEDEIQEIREMQRQNTESLKKLEARMDQNEEQSNRRSRNKLRDLLLQNFRYYTNPKTNPNQTWTHMEAETFWELFHDYEDMGGNGYVHSEVLPKMEQLLVVDSNGMPEKPM